MFLEFVTFIMLLLVLVLKYGTVTRIVKLNQRLRDAEGKCRRSEDRLRLQRNERRIAEREEVGLTRQQVSLESEMERLEGDLTALKESNIEVLQQLTRSPNVEDLGEGLN
ncbi:MAG: hypothetical protein O2954_14485 [bacterium]|nr:hypothetical protein [bacterium]